MKQFIEHECAIEAAEPVFAGHFPDRPILPGVMLLALAREAMAARLGRTPRLLKIVRQRFLNPVLPGVTLRIECEIKNEDAAACHVLCRWILPDGTLAARGELLMA